MISADFDRATELFADRLSELVMVKVRAALALEAARHDAELSEIRADLANIGRRVELLAAGGGLHSVRVEPPL